MWSRIIHTWPSFALIGAYELLMREFRTAARGVRSADAERTHAEEVSSVSEDRAQAEGAGLYVVREQHIGTPDWGEPSHPVQPEIQVRAWRWAAEQQRVQGTLPTGDQIAAAFGRKPRWGRLISQWGRQGRFDDALLNLGSEARRRKPGVHGQEAGSSTAT